MNREAADQLVQADKELNLLYRKIVKDYREDTVFIGNFRRAQKLWIQFRDAEMKMKYPDRPAGYYGTVQPMCWSNYLTALTEERIKTLRVWADGIEEGDVCAGSVKTKQ